MAATDNLEKSWPKVGAKRHQISTVHQLLSVEGCGKRQRGGNRPALPGKKPRFPLLNTAL